MLRRLARPSLARNRIWLAAGLTIATAGCRSTGPAPAPATATTAPAQRAPWANAVTPGAALAEVPPEPLALAPAPAATSPTTTLAELAIAPMARVVADLNTLGRELPLRLGDQMLQSILSKAAEEKFPVDAELVAALATDRPLSVIVASHGQGKPPGICGAAPLARPADAGRLVAKLGVPISRRGGAVERRHGTTSFWTGVSDGTVVLAKTYDDLWSICARAIAATRRPLPADEVIASVDPEAVRAATGSTWDQVAGEIRKLAQDPEVLAAANANKKPGTPATPMLQKMMAQLGDGFAFVLSQTARARAGIAVSAADGLVMSTSLEPKAGTQLAASTAAATSFTLDDRLPVRDDRTGFSGWGSLDVYAPLMRMLLPGAPAHGGGAAGASPVDGFLSAFSGAGSCTFEFAESPPSSVCSLPLRPGADPRTALRHYADLVNAVLVWEADIVGLPHRKAAQIRNGVLEFDRPLAPTSVGTEQYQTIRSFMGGDTVKYAAAIRGDRLLQFQGGSPRAKLQAWTDGAKTKGAAPAHPPLMSKALARMHGYSLGTLMDPLVLVFTMFEHAADARTRQAAAMFRALPGLATTRTPLMFAATGGPNLGYEFHIPVVTFDNIGKLIRPFAGMMGAASQ